MHPKTAVAVDVGLLLAPPLPTRLLSVLRDKTREESKTVEDFLKSLENGHKALANVLKHRNNQGKWAYLRQVWSGSALAPTPTPNPIPAPTAVRQKRGAVAGGPHHRRSKRVRSAALTGGMRVQDK